MSITDEQLGSFGDLATAIGLMRDGSPNASWFTDPVGNVAAGDGFRPGLRSMLADDVQRDALTSFVDEVLGPPERETEDGEVWIPLFAETSPNVTIYAVLEPRAGSVRLGVGVVYETGTGTPRVAVRAHVPIFQVERRGGSLEAGDSSTPDWFLLGGPHGTVTIGVEAVLDEGSPPPGQASLGGVELAVSLPTSATGNVSFALALQRLQLAGAATPQDFALDVDDLDELDDEVLNLLIGLIRAQADALDLGDSTLRPFAALTGMLGIRDVAGIPPLPLAELPTAGVDAVVGWVREVLATDASRDAWLGELAALIGGTADPANDAVAFTLGPAEVLVGLRTGPGVSGLPVLIPWVEVGADTGGGTRGRVEATADLFRLDTGSGDIAAIPLLHAEAVLGVDAGGSALLTGDPGVGSLRIGVAFRAGAPTFTFTLGDVVLNGRSHDLVDLSSPDAALDAADTLIDGAVAAALAGLGPAGDLISTIIGVQPPTGLAGTDVVALLADPLAELASYWSELAGVVDAMPTVLGQLQELLTGTAAASVPGSGTVADPWTVALGGPVSLAIAHEAGELRCALGATSTTTVLGDHEVVATIAVDLARIRLADLSADFVTGSRGELRLRRADATPIRLSPGDLSIKADHVAIALGWDAGTGPTLRLDAPGLALAVAGTLDLPSIDVAVPLPTFGPGGAVSFAPPDWGDVEAALVALLARVDSPTIDAVLDVLGWTADGPRLSLGALIVNPDTAISAWLADLVLDCDRVRDALVPIAALCSGFRGELLGIGTVARPFRCPVGGEPAAPGMAVWLEPGCPPPPDPVGFDTERLRTDEPIGSAEVVAVIGAAGDTLASVGDLLVGRDGLAEGLDLLRDRWNGSDGLVAPPAVAPDGVATVVIPDSSYHELVALGAAGGLVFDVFDPLPSAVVHVGCERAWVTDRPDGTDFDLSESAGDAGPFPASGDGEWYVRLPDANAAAAARPDLGSVGEQAARLVGVLAARTDPITVVAYGDAAAAALRATADIAAIERVATVGAPWGALSVDSLATGLSGDALRLLDLLRPPTADADPDVLDAEGDPARRLSRVVERSILGLRESRRPPSPVAETPRAGVEIAAVFGALDPDAIEIGIARLVADGLDARLLAATAADLGPETALHVGVGVPAFDLDIGGLLVGAGVTLGLCTVGRAPDDTLLVDLDRHLLVDVHFGVHDGWLVGGPGATQHDLALRWMSARVDMPLDGGTGNTMLTLHESTAFGVFRERWVVGPDDVVATADATVSTLLPEVRTLVAQVVQRVEAEAADVAAALGAAGLVRDGGLDPAALDRWVLDTTSAARDAVAAGAADIAAAIRTLIGDTGSTGSALAWSLGGATLGVDLATGILTATVSAPTDGPPVTATVDASPTGASVSAAVGRIDPDLGGIRVVATAGTGASPTLAIEMAPAGAAVPDRVPLYPSVDMDGVVRVAATLVPAGLAARVIDDLRGNATAAGSASLEQVLDLVGALGPPQPGGYRPTLVPFGLFVDPEAWVRSGVAAWRASFAASAVSLLDLVSDVVVPGPAGRWQLTPELAVAYEVAAGSLRLGVQYSGDVSVGASSVSTSLEGGLVIGSSRPSAPYADTSVTVDGHGVRLMVDAAVDPAVRLDLVRPAPRPAVELYPAGSGIGDIAAAAGGMVAPIVLNGLIAHRDDAAPSLTRDAARVAFDLGGALDLLESDQFTAARIESFAADPAAALIARLPQVAASGVARLADALDPGGALVAADEPGPGQTRLAFGVAGSLSVLVDGSGATPAVEFAADVDLGDVGHLVVERLRISAAGASIAARFGPATLNIGPVTLFPVVVVRAGITDAGFTRAVGVGLATDATGAASVEFRWGLDATPPELRLITRPGGVEAIVGDPVAAGLQLLGAAASLATGILLEELDDLLSSTATAWLQGVVFTDVAGSATVDANLFVDLLDPEALVDRLLRFAWNLATESPPSITIDGKVTIGLVANGPTSNRRLGINLDLTDPTGFTLASGDTQVDLVVNANWISPEQPAGLTVELLAGTMTSLQFTPGVIVGGLGIRVSKTSGPLLDLGGVSIDAIAVHTYAEANSAGGLGGGIELQLDGFAFAPAAGGGNNQVANSLLNDAGAAGDANRPAFSPALSVQQHPGESSPSIGLRAGDPPGPWWVVVQRQLGPIYIEQVGLDTVESGGQVTRISLMFDGSVSLFGLQAAVEQLSLNWNGGDVLSLSSWSVDLMGLAVSADLSGAYLAGGLLKSEEGGQISYVGMLLGRFGVYGLSVFGGYTDDNGSPSFFVFGAFVGPIGGPPAFFLTGIGGGLGINRALRVPDDLSQFGEYPFIKALDPAAGPSDDPIGELRALGEYFPPESGNFWFAAGISFTCFSLIDGIAVVSVSFGTGFELNIFGLARLALPRPQVALVSIELGLLVRFSTTEGLFLMQAQLTDNSWLLYEEVRLTGGFAMATWWKGALAGQFVVSLGGYHPDFHREGYPIVPRLGLEWRITDDIVIKGGSYFALTSEALMAGVDIELSADWGWAWVRVAFGAHAIVFFDPFFFMAMAYARISAGVKINVLFGTISISISIGARIEVEGPDFSGRATFEIGPCELSVSFGDSHKERTPALDWSEFVPKYLEDAGGNEARALTGITGRGTLPAATNGDTAAPSSDGTRDRPFEVFAEFEISFVTTVPVTEFRVESETEVITPKLPDNTSSTLGVAPMGVDSASSALEIRLERFDHASGQYVEGAEQRSDLAKLAAGLAHATSDLATPHVRTDSFPIGVWGPSEDENAKPLPKGDVIRAGNMIKLVAGIEGGATGPEIDYRQVDAKPEDRRPLPLLVADDDRIALLATAGAVSVQAPTSAQAALDAASTLLFASAGTSSASTVGGLQPRGRHGAVAVAAFAGDRTAPPRFGSLAGGIRAQNAPRATIGRIDRPSPLPGRVARTPTVIGMLAAGPGVVSKGPATSVADGRIKRRPAPAVDAVRGRLGDELPIKLDRPAVPATELDGTLVVGAYPRTDLAGAAASHVGGRLGSPHLDTLVGGLARSTGPAPLAASASSPVRSGDIVAIERPDAAIDVDPSARPTLEIGGAARVVMLRPGGRVAVDTEVSDGSVHVPPRVRLIAVQADGELDVSDGLPGWHARTRLGRIGVGSAVGPGCVVSSDAAQLRRRTGWVAGRDLVAGANTVTTRFARPASYVAVVLDGEVDTDVLPMQIELRGAKRAVDGRGGEVAPTVVLAGAQSAVLVPIVADGDAFAVVVHAGGEWQLGGVLAGTGDLDDASDVVAARGVDALAARLLAVSGTGCTITWTDPVASPAKKGAAKRGAAKKGAAKKGAAKKPAAKKRGASPRGRDR